MADDSDGGDCPAGAPAWVMTFADLMSLLMCFFVLLLSFATMDANRFKKMAESMKDAFGVQQDVPAYDDLRGTSVIAQHFSPGTPDETVTDEVRQATVQERPNLDIPEISEEALQKEEDKRKQQRQAELENDAEMIRQVLQEEIRKGLVSVETEDSRIIIRIQEKASFPSGSSVLNTGFEPVMKKITAAINDHPGNITIAGHTDDIPIATVWYRSNWELSASRAVTVAHEVLKDKTLDPGRLKVEGHAETDPLVPNDSPANRAINRRVEIILQPEENQPRTMESVQ